MRIDEFSNKPEMDFKFDLVDDASFFMKNDPTFYRKQYYPTMCKIADKHNAGIKVDRNMIEKMVSNGIFDYVKKFNLGRSAEDVFKQNDREALIDYIFSEEMKEVAAGTYT